MSCSGRRRSLRRAIAISAALVAFVVPFSPADAAGSPTWSSRVAAAQRYAEGRVCLVAFAVVDERGWRHRYRAWAVAPSASVLKAMLLVAYLRKA
jgi:beta-lactamase class A